MKGSTAQIEGVRFTSNNLTFNGSKVDKKFSYSKINYALRQNSHKVQTQNAQNLQPLLPKQEFTQTDSASLLSDIGGLFGDLLSVNPTNDPEEDEFRRLMQRKKKKGIRR